MNEFFSCPLEIKFSSGASAREFEGYGSIFGNEDLGGDIVVKGAFAKSLAEHKVNGTSPQMYWMHQPDKVPGKWLAMEEDEQGLAVKGVLAETPLGDEMRALMKMDAIRGLSIGVRRSTMVVDYDREGRRLIKQGDLWEVSIVSLAMNPLAEIASVKSQLSSAGEFVPTPRQFEKMFRDMGCTQLTAKRLLAKVFDDARDVRRAPARDVRDEAGSDAFFESLAKLQLEARWVS